MIKVRRIKTGGYEVDTGVSVMHITVRHIPVNLYWSIAFDGKIVDTALTLKSAKRKAKAWQKGK